MRVRQRLERAARLIGLALSEERLREPEHRFRLEASARRLANCLIERARSLVERLQVEMIAAHLDEQPGPHVRSRGPLRVREGRGRSSGCSRRRTLGSQLPAEGLERVEAILVRRERRRALVDPADVAGQLVEKLHDALDGQRTGEPEQLVAVHVHQHQRRRSADLVLARIPGSRSMSTRTGITFCMALPTRPSE